MGKEEKVRREIVKYICSVADPNERWLRMVSVANESSVSSILCATSMLCMYEIPVPPQRKPCKCKKGMHDILGTLRDTLTHYRMKPSCQYKIAMLALKERPGDADTIQTILDLQRCPLKEQRSELYQLSGWKAHAIICCGFLEVLPFVSWSNDETNCLERVVETSDRIMDIHIQYLPKAKRRELWQQQTLDTFTEL